MKNNNNNNGKRRSFFIVGGYYGLKRKTLIAIVNRLENYLFLVRCVYLTNV